MLVHSKTHLKCEVLGISHFCRRKNFFFSKNTWRLPHYPAAIDFSNTKIITVSYTKVSSLILGSQKLSRFPKIMSEIFLVHHHMKLPWKHSLPHYTSKSQRPIIYRWEIWEIGKDDDLSPGGTIIYVGYLSRTMLSLQIVGLKEKINDLKIIHVAGTKGKGSTCAFSEAILRECGFRTGLFTSPHLIDVRERIRVNGLDISEDEFLLHFWDCWNLLKEKVSDDLPMPPLFQFLTILAFKVFTSEQVDVAIIEVGLGGKKDSTNVIKAPVVCGISSLGMDHMDALGDTLAEIALHKAGIFKHGVPAFSAPQLSEAMDVLQERASELMIPLEIAAPLDRKRLEGLKLGLSGDHQYINAGLAVSLCKCWLQKTGKWDNLIGKKEDDEGDELDIPEAFLRGLSMARLSGRAQVVHDIPLVLDRKNTVGNIAGKLVFYLDGAHSPESMEACVKWFSSAIKWSKTSASSTSLSSYEIQHMKLANGNGFVPHEKESNSDTITKQILLFNCMEVRDPHILLPQLVNSCASSGTHFSKALFVPSMSTYSKVTSGATIVPSDVFAKDLTWQFSLQRIWEKIVHGKDPLFKKSYKAENLELLPPHEFLYEDITRCNPDKHFSCSAVMPSLPLTIKWLRDCVGQNPSLRLEVLVTGSLHLVGDVLKLLRR